KSARAGAGSPRPTRTFPGLSISERNPGRNDRELLARGGSGAFAGRRRTRSDRLLRATLRENGTARNGPLVYVALGQRRIFGRRKKADRNFTNGDARAEVRSTR